MANCHSLPGLRAFLGCSFKSRIVLGKVGPVGHGSGRPSLVDREIIIRPHPAPPTNKTELLHSFSTHFFLSPPSFLPLNFPLQDEFEGM